MHIRTHPYTPHAPTHTLTLQTHVHAHSSKGNVFVHIHTASGIICFGDMIIIHTSPLMRTYALTHTHRTGVHIHTASGIICFGDMIIIHTSPLMRTYAVTHTHRTGVHIHSPVDACPRTIKQLQGTHKHILIFQTQTQTAHTSMYANARYQRSTNMIILSSIFNSIFYYYERFV